MSDITNQRFGVSGVQDALARRTFRQPLQPVQGGDGLASTSATCHLHTSFVVTLHKDALCGMQEYLPLLKVSVKILLQFVLTCYLYEVALVVGVLRIITGVAPFFYLSYDLVNVLLVKQVKQMLKDISRKVVLVLVQILQVSYASYQGQQILRHTNLQELLVRVCGKRKWLACFGCRVSAVGLRSCQDGDDLNGARHLVPFKALVSSPLHGLVMMVDI